MALRTLGTNTTTSLQCLTNWAANLSQTDVGNLSESILSDFLLAAVSGIAPAGIAVGMTTASTHSNTTLDTLVAVSGYPLSQIAVGDMVLGIGIVLGTTVARLISGTSVQLSQAATTTAASVRVIFARGQNIKQSLMMADARLFVPNRGILKVLPGDVPAVDNTGWPILLSGASIAYAGSQWTLT